jgi:hypothetical protein
MNGGKEAVMPDEKLPVAFNPTRNYTGVDMQQGRVPVDPDSNEQGAIDGRLPVLDKPAVTATLKKPVGK